MMNEDVSLGVIGMKNMNSRTCDIGICIVRFILMRGLWGCDGDMENEEKVLSILARGTGALRESKAANHLPQEVERVVVELVLAASVSLQPAAAILALRLIWITRNQGVFMYEQLAIFLSKMSPLHRVKSVTRAYSS